ncbi:MAG: ribonuclease HII [Clostridia bacterium]|jgi:ribonuclease HII|nr:ribonuclease HII [Clostridia bacterium]
MAVRIKFDDKEKERLIRMTEYERKCYEKGYKLIAGVDEVGRGPLAGPVVAAAVILGEGVLIPGVNDSKKLSEEKREYLYDEIKSKALCWSIGIVDEKVIDEINILNAACLAMKKALDGLADKPDYILLDAVTLKDVDIPQKGIIKGDALSLSIAAASIIAKVERDRMISAYDELYPHYAFSKHKGYGTREHIECIKKYGLLPIHRRSFTKNFQG